MFRHKKKKRNLRAIRSPTTDLSEKKDGFLLSSVNVNIRFTEEKLI